MSNLKRIIIGSRNLEKVREIEKILTDLPVELATLDDFENLTCKSVPEVIEDGKTFEENAVKKAIQLADFTGECVVADDSGLEVDALGGQPGVLSARYSGKSNSCIASEVYEANNRKLLAEMAHVPAEKRTARFRCVIALAEPERIVITVEGQCEGIITYNPRGKHGFGYDPIFFVPEYNATFAELGPDIKNRISHRARALEKFRECLYEKFTYWH